MNRCIVSLVGLVIGINMSHAVWGQNHWYWQNPLGSNWHTAANWADFIGGFGAVPGPNDRAEFGLSVGFSPSTPVFLSNNAHARELWGTAQINLRGHEFTFGPSGPWVRGDFTFFSGDGAVGTVTGGDLEVELQGLTIGRNTTANFSSLRGAGGGVGVLTVRDGAEVFVSEPLATFFMIGTVTGAGSRLNVAGSLPAGVSGAFPSYDWFVRDEGYLRIDGSVSESFSAPSRGLFLENGVLEISSALGSRSLGGYGVVVAPSSTTFTGPGIEITDPLDQVKLSGTLAVEPAQAATFFSLGPARLGIDTNVNSGALRSASGFLLDNNRWITTLGTSTIEGPLTMAGGVVDASADTTLASAVHGFGTVVGAAVPTHPSSTINNPSGTVVLDRALNIGDRIAVIYSAGPAQLGPLTTLAGGTLRVQSGFASGQPVLGALSLASGRKLSGGGEVLGDFVANEFSIVEVAALSALWFGGPDSANWRGFVTDGDVIVNGQLRLSTSSPAVLGRHTQLNGGSIISPGDLTLRDHSTLAGSGTVNSRVAGATGSIIRAEGGNLALGSSSAVDGFATEGQLHTGPNQVTLNDANQAVLGSLTTLGEGGSPGTLAAANSLVLNFGRDIVGHGTIDTPNDPLRPTLINGHAAGNSAAQPLTFNGYVKGVGTFADVVFNGTFAPGLSPAAVETGNLAFGSESVLQIELGGLAPGSGHDQLVVNGTLQLDGTLQVQLINGFQPAVGDQFEILTYESLSGTFSDVAFAGALHGVLDYGDSSLVLTFAAVPEPSTAALALMVLGTALGCMGRSRNRRRNRRRLHPMEAMVGG